MVTEMTQSDGQFWGEDEPVGCNREQLWSLYCGLLLWCLAFVVLSLWLSHEPVQHVVQQLRW